MQSLNTMHIYDKLIEIILPTFILIFTLPLFVLSFPLIGKTKLHNSEPEPEGPARWKVDGCLAALEDSYPIVKKLALDKLKELNSIDKIPEDRIGDIAKLLDNGNNDVRKMARETLIAVKEKITPEVMENIAYLLNHENEEVRIDVLKTLKEMETSFKLTNYITKKIRELLKDKNEDIVVRYEAVMTLGRMTDRIDDKTIINILELFDDYEEYSTKRHKISLSTPTIYSKYLYNETPLKVIVKILIGVKKVNDDVIRKILKYSYHENPDVSQAAKEILIGMKEKINDDIIKKISVLLDDENNNVRIAAIKTLGVMKEKINDDDIIKKISVLLDDKNSNVRLAAIKTLGAMKGKINDDIIKKISVLLDDKNSNVRIAAIETLGAMKGKINDDIIKKISVNLDDENSNVRIAAIKTLGAMKEKINDDDIIKKISVLLMDENSNVRIVAIKTL